MKFNKKMSRRFYFIFISLFIFFLAYGCSSKDSKSSIEEKNAGQAEKVDKKSAKLKSIEDIFVEEGDDSVSVNIKGDSELTYSAVKEKDPEAVVLYFPATKIAQGLNEKNYSNSCIEKIQLTQEENYAKLRIFLSSDLPYSMKKEGYTLALKLDTASQSSIEAVEEEAPSKESFAENDEKMSAAKKAERLEDVEVFEDGDSLGIKIIADGAIKKYNSFTLNNPPRIVFDIADISSFHKEVKKIDLNNKWAKSIRYYSNNSRFRIVIDSRIKWLENYGAETVDDGIIIYIGKNDEEGLLNTSSGVEEKNQAVAGPASLTDIKFSALEDGSSKVFISTSKKVDYKTEKTGEKQIAIRLVDTKIASYNQRPIITSRFDSAVNRIFPVYNKKVNARDSVVIIDLRENVAFQIDDEKENTIEIEFGPSSLSGSSDNVVMAKPQWEKVLSDSPAVVAESGISSPLTNNDINVAPQTDADIAGSISGIGNNISDSAISSSSSGDKKYTGQLISIDFYDTDIRNVFRIIQHVSGLNFAIDRDVTGKVTMSLKQPVPWDQILDVILKMNSLGMQQEGTIVRIARLSSLESEEQRKQQVLKAKQESKKQEKSLEPLFTEYLLINYSDAGAEVLPHIQKVMTKRGSASVDKRNNQLIVTDTRESIDKIRDIISRIDKITPQVVIEARIVEANSDFAKELGTEWNASTSRNAAAERSRYTAQPAGDWDWGYNVAMNVPQQLGLIDVGFAKLSGLGVILNAKLRAMETQKKGRIVSAPKVVTLDNKKATITQGYEYPYTTLKDGETTTEFKDIDLQLDVTPHVTADNKISLKVNIDKNDIYVQTPDGPALSTKSIETELLVNDGDTIVIGGIIQKSETKTVNRFPWLSRIPILGWLFKSKADANTKNELLIFITPRIVELGHEGL
ncbi:MAG: hypothetical protein CSB21_03850 [Deltaproteobacteria bacterium]|nr:MAG: hypothetical protein CSB21_03850 [Deltaproteobacteria bacterium]